MIKLILCLLLIAGSVLSGQAQELSISCISELQTNLQTHAGNWCNLLRSDFILPVSECGQFEWASLHFFKTRKERIADDLLTFSNIEEENTPCAVAVLGYTQRMKNGSLFLGIRNLNEDYFTAPAMSVFTNSSCGIFPTLSLNYPLANYPVASVCLDYTLTIRQLEWRSSLYNGTGYSGWNRDTHPFRVNFGRDGLLALTTLNYTTDDGNYTWGNSVYRSGSRCDVVRTQKSEKIFNPSTQKNTAAWWGYIEQKIRHKPGSELTALIHYSGSNAHFCKAYWGTGLVWKQALNKQQKQVTTAAYVSTARLYHSREITSEFTACFDVHPNLTIQPALHLIKNADRFYTVAMIRFGYKITIPTNRYFK